MKTHMPMQKSPAAKETKGRRFVRKFKRVAKVFGTLLGGGLIITANAQAPDNAKAPASAPSGKQIEITMADLGSRVPDNTYMAPTVGNDTLTHYYANNAKTAKKIEPGPDPNAPFKVEGGWAESVEIRHDSLICNNYKVKGRQVLFGGTPVGKFLRARGIDPNNKSIKGAELTEIDANTQCAGIVFESNGKSLLYYSVANTITSKVAVNAISASDGSIPFGHKGAIFTASDGTLLASTPTTLLIIKPTGDRWYVEEINYTMKFGAGEDFTRPTFRNYQGLVMILDPTLVATNQYMLFNSDIMKLDLIDNIPKDAPAQLGMNISK